MSTTTVTATIRIFSDFTADVLAGYASVTPDFEHAKRRAHRDCLAGGTVAQRDAYRQFLQSAACNPSIELQDPTGHPLFADVITRVRAAIVEYNKLNVQTINPIEDGTDPTCVEWVELPDGTVIVIYNWDTELAANDCPPPWPQPRGRFRAQFSYRIASE